MSPDVQNRSGRQDTFGAIITEPIFDISPVRPPANIDEIDVVCCICEEMIPMTQVDEHSRMCEYKR